MAAAHELGGFEDFLSRSYGKPETKTVKVPPPEPSVVELDEEFLETLPDGTKRPKSSKLRITVGAADYPEKIVKVRRLKETSETVREDEDQGPTGAYKLVSNLLWAISAVMAFAFMSTNATLVIIPVILALVTFAIRSHLKATQHIIVAVERKVVKHVEYTKDVTINVDQKYAPRTETHEIPNETRITAVGVLTIPFDAVAFGAGSLLVDSLQLGKPPTLQLPTLRDPDGVRELMERLDAALAEIPAILSGEHEKVGTISDTDFPDGVPMVGAELDILRGFEELIAAISHTQNLLLRPNIIEPSNPLVPMLSRIHGIAASESAMDKDFVRLRTVIPEEARRDSERILERFLESWNKHHLAMTKIRFESLAERISPHLLTLGYLSSYSSFNFYCPHCIRELALSMIARDYSLLSAQETLPVMFSRNSRCVFDPQTEKWRCRACGSWFIGQDLIPIHKVLDDVLYPAYDRLMEENKIKRLEMDNKTRDDVITYENKRSQEIDTIQMTHERDCGSAQSNIEMARAEVNGQRQSIAAIIGIMDAYKIQQTGVIKSIDDRCNQIQDEIRQTVESRRAQADDKYLKMLDGFRNSMTAIGMMKREEDIVRDQIQVGILANTTAIASHTADIRESSRQTAQHTADIRQSSREIASHTADIRVSNREIASHTADIRESNREIASHTADIRESSRQTAANTTDISASNRQIASTSQALLGKTEAIHAGIRENNAIQAACAQKQGIDVYDAAWFRIDKNLPKFAANIVSDLCGSTSKDRTKRIQQYLN